MLGPGWTEVVALTAAFAIAVPATPAGVSGAVLLLPFQVGVLGTPSPAVTPTNLLYNVVATPGALIRYWRQGQSGGRLAALLMDDGGGSEGRITTAMFIAAVSGAVMHPLVAGLDDDVLRSQLLRMAHRLLGPDV